MQHSSTLNKVGNHNEPLTSVQLRQPSTDVDCTPTSQCIALNDIAPTRQPSAGRSAVTGHPRRGRILGRSASERVDSRIPLPRWDGISVWVPNTAATASAARNRGRRQPVQRSKTYTAPSQAATTVSPPPTTTTANMRLSRGAELLSAASSMLARAWNRQTARFTRSLSKFQKTTTTDDFSATCQSDDRDQKSSTLIICRKCQGRAFDSNRPADAATIPLTANTVNIASPEVQIPTANRDLETDSGYLVGLATSNSPNDVISCRTLPSTSPDDVTGQEDQNGAKHSETAVDVDDAHCSPGPAADGGVLVVKDALHPKDLLDWKLSLMDRAEEGLITTTPWLNGGSLSSSDDDDEADSAAKMSAGEVDNTPDRAESSGSEFSFEDDFERALEEAESSTMTQRDDVGYAVSTEDTKDVEKLFDAKLDELLRTRCDVVADRPTSAPVKFEDETRRKLRALTWDTADLKVDSTTHVHSNDWKPTTDCASPSTVIANLLRDDASGGVVEWPPPATSLTGVRSTAAVVHKTFHPADVDASAIHRSSSLRVSSSTDGDGTRYLSAKDGSVCCRLRFVSRSKSAPTAGRSWMRGRLSGGRQPVSDQQRENSFSTQSEPMTFSRRCNETPSTAGDLDNKRRATVDDDVEELVDKLIATLLRVNGRKTSQMRRVNVVRLRRHLLQNIRNALWTDSEATDSSTDTENNNEDNNDDDDDKSRRLRTIVNSLLDCPGEDDVSGIAHITKYVMTCPLLQEATDAGDWSRRWSGTDGREIVVFVLRHGVTIDGLHVSVAGRTDLPVNATKDFREYKLKFLATTNWPELFALYVSRANCMGCINFFISRTGGPKK